MSRSKWTPEKMEENRANLRDSFGELQMHTQAFLAMQKIADGQVAEWDIRQWVIEQLMEFKGEEMSKSHHHMDFGP